MTKAISAIHYAMLRFGWGGARRAYGTWQLPTSEKRLAALATCCESLPQPAHGYLQFLEIGSLLGVSARVLARYGGVTCVDPWPWGMTAFIRNTSDLPVWPIRGASWNVLPKLRDRYFDLAYIDGSHLEGDVAGDIRECRRLVRPGGIICGDDLERQIPDVPEAEADADMRASGEWTGTYHPGVTLAVHRLLGPVQSHHGFWWKDNLP